MYQCHQNTFITVICTIKAIPMRICHVINQLAIYPCAKTWKCHQYQLYRMVMPKFNIHHTCSVWYDFSIFNKTFSDTYTVTQAVNALGFGWFQVKLSLCVGLCWMADSMEMTILSVLGPALHCDWGISRYQQALVTTIVFLGMMMSSTFWGQLSDRYGRKPVLILFQTIWTTIVVHAIISLFPITGTHILWNIAVSLWISEFASPKLCMAIVAAWFSGFCHWMCTAERDIVCRISANQTTCEMCSFTRCKFYPFWIRLRVLYMLILQLQFFSVFGHLEPALKLHSH